MIEKQVVQIIIDDRESRSGLIEELIEYEYKNMTTHVTTHIETTRLEVGDIICSDRVIIERKAVSDFVESFIDGRLFGQVADMATSEYTKPAVILEGKTVFGLRDVNPEALRAAMSGIAIGWGVPIIPTKNVAETAAMVVTIARREQFQMKRSISIHGKRSHLSIPQQQVYFISAIRNLGPETAARLLKHFGTPEAVVSATTGDLMDVHKIGEKTATVIREVVGTEYKG